MKKLTAEQCKELSAFKGKPNGKMEFFEKLKEYYEGDADTLTDIEKLQNLFESVEEIQFWGAYQKSTNMYYDYMDDFLNKIGYKFVEEETSEA